MPTCCSCTHREQGNKKIKKSSHLKSRWTNRGSPKNLKRSEASIFFQEAAYKGLAAGGHWTSASAPASD